MQQPFELIRSCRRSATQQLLRPTKRFCHDPFALPLSDFALTPSARDHQLHLDLPITPSQTDSCQSSEPLSCSPITHLPADKLTKLRAVGQTHRDNEKEYYKLLLHEIEGSRRENALLFALFATRYKSDKGLLPPLSMYPIFSCLPGDNAEDYDVDCDETAVERGMHKLSTESAMRLGQKYVSTALAVVMLELIIYRRNLVPDLVDEPSHDTSAPRRRRRRTGLRAATSKTTAEHIMEFARQKFAQEDHGDEDIVAFVDRRLGSLSFTMSKWNEMEANYDPPKVLMDDMVPNVLYSPRSLMPEETNEICQPFHRRRGEGAKRCSRCNMVKFAGSGHGRSKCDDGFSVSSLVPYPASQLLDDGS